MSLVAQVWSNGLPLDIGVNYAAYRVLGKLCDAHHAETNSAWRHVDRLAAELSCSKRTVQRALKDLEILGLIQRGNQRMVGHIDARYRPTVWALDFDRWRAPLEHPELEGVTANVTPGEPVDNPPRGDRHAAPGVTTVVAHRNGDRTLTTSTSATTDRARLCAHTWRSTSIGDFCASCGVRRDGQKVIDWESLHVRPVRRSA